MAEELTGFLFEGAFFVAVVFGLLLVCFVSDSPLVGDSIFAGAVFGRSVLRGAVVFTVITAFSAHSLIYKVQRQCQIKCFIAKIVYFIYNITFVIFKLSTSLRNGMIVFSPTSFIAVPSASAELSRTVGSGKII